MLGNWESGKKITIARKLLIDMVDSLKNIDNIELALRVYGHQSHVPPQDCNDTKLEVPFSKDNSSKIRQKLYTIKPKGTTPIARSLELCANDFPKRDNCRNVIILITDGIEACDGDPCAVSLALQKKGISLKPFVIGIGLDVEFKETFECVGSYYDAANEDQFKNVLGIVISQALNNTTAQVNLLDIKGNPTETNVNMTFYDDLSGMIKHNYIHTMNSKGLPDTLILDPLTTYDMVVHTIPPVEVKNIKVTAGKHSVIAADTPQGDLILKMQKNNLYKSLKFIVRKSGKTKTLNVQEVNETERYIVGKYDLEILTLPRIYVDKVDISQSHTTKIEIPQPGILTILTASPGYGGVYHINKNKMELVFNLNPDITKETIVLQPGKYKLVFRGKSVNNTIETFTKSFEIKSGSSIPLRIN